MAGGKGLRPHIRLVCPDCDIDLNCYVRDPEISPLLWVLTEKSRKHLEEATCKPVVPQLHIVQPIVEETAA